MGMLEHLRERHLHRPIISAAIGPLSVAPEKIDCAMLLTIFCNPRRAFPIISIGIDPHNISGDCSFTFNETRLFLNSNSSIPFTNYYKDWLSKLESANVELSVKWKNEQGNLKSWYQTPLGMQKIRSSLDIIKEVTVEEVILHESLMGASLLKGSFEFIDSEKQEKISGKTKAEIRHMMKEYFGRECKATFQKEVLHNTTTDQLKVTWTLVNLEN